MLNQESGHLPPFLLQHSVFFTTQLPRQIPRQIQQSFPRSLAIGPMLPRESAKVAALLAAVCLSLSLLYVLARQVRAWWGAGGTRRKPSLDFSITGLIYCSMMMFMGLAAINSQANLLFGVFGLMVGILLISGIVSRKVMRRLKVRRLLPDHGVVGRAMTLTYQVTNDKRFWPSLSVTIAELDGAAGFTKQPQAYMLHAAPGATASIPAQVIPRCRGLHVLDRFQVSTSFPFGFIKRALTDRHRDVLFVYPALAQVDRKVLTLCRAAEKTGASIRPRKGGSDEFYGVKEHRPGDNPRWIYWRRSARTGSAGGPLVAKEMTHVAPPRLMVLVDTFLPDPAAKGPAADKNAAASARASVEKAIAMAASLAAAALDEDLSVGLFVWSDGWRGIEPSRGKRHRNDLLSVLARLPRNRTHDAAALIQQARRFLHSGTTAVLFAPPPAPTPSPAKMAPAPAPAPSNAPTCSPSPQPPPIPPLGSISKHKSTSPPLPQQRSDQKMEPQPPLTPHPQRIRPLQVLSFVAQLSFPRPTKDQRPMTKDQ